jgi:hypothetical protein
MEAEKKTTIQNERTEMPLRRRQAISCFGNAGLFEIYCVDWNKFESV